MVCGNLLGSTEVAKRLTNLRAVGRTYFRIDTATLLMVSIVCYVPWKGAAGSAKVHEAAGSVRVACQGYEPVQGLPSFHGRQGTIADLPINVRARAQYALVRGVAWVR